MSYRYEDGDDDYVTETISDPLSVPYACGTMVAAFEVLFARELGATYKVLSPRMLEITCFPQEHTREFKGKPKMPIYHHREGDIALERCASCGGPVALSGCRWYPGEGMIMNMQTGRRMALLGVEANALFEELERELGEIIPRAAVEAQRRFVKPASIPWRMWARRTKSVPSSP